MITTFTDDFWLNIHNEFGSLDGEIFSDSCPEELVHYTTPEGFAGITSTHEIWCTDIRHVADKCECDYGMDVIRRVIAKQSVPPIIKAAIQSESSLLGTKKIATGFIACFCSPSGESPYMWKHYAAGGTGHAIVCDGKLLSHGAQGGKRYALFPVIYDQDAQIEKTTQIIERALQLQHKWKISGEELTKFQTEQVGYSLMVCGLRFKKPCFKNEQALRLFAWDTDDLKKVEVQGKTHIAMPFESSAILRCIRGPDATDMSDGRSSQGIKRPSGRVHQS